MKVAGAALLLLGIAGVTAYIYRDELSDWIDEKLYSGKYKKYKKFREA